MLTVQLLVSARPTESTSSALRYRALHQGSGNPPPMTQKMSKLLNQSLVSVIRLDLRATNINRSHVIDWKNNMVDLEYSQILSFAI